MIDNLEVKVEALRQLVSEASRQAKPSPIYPFHGDFGKNLSLSHLLEALETTDALDVLNYILNERDKR